MRKTLALYLMPALCIFLVMGGAVSPALAQSGILTQRRASDIGLQQTTTQAPVIQEAYVKPPTLEKAVDPDVYVLGPSDELIVQVVSAEPLSYSLTVLPEGDVLVPDVGAVHADGFTLNQFRAELTTKLNRYYRNIEVFCFLKVPAQFRVFITGEVKSPGAVSASGIQRVSDAIQGGGGMTDIGSQRLIMLVRGADTLRVDLLRFLDRGDLKDNPFLRSGDRVYVPPAAARASIYGGVKSPGLYEIVPGETVERLITLAGGFTSDASMDSVVLTKIGPAGDVSTSTITAAQFGATLNDKDEVGVFELIKGRRVVYVQGTAVRTGKFILAPNEGVRDLIARFGGFNDKADLSAAYVNHLNGKTDRIDLKAMLAPGSTEDFALADGDALTIPAVAMNVAVGGEVNKPGEFAYSGDLTVAQYVGLAGGPTRDGSLSRVVIYSSNGTHRSASRDSRPSRGDIIIVKRSIWSLGGELFGGLIRIGTVVVSIYVLTK
jgi:protein involved in polysaccharide export with SLBB domain